MKIVIKSYVPEQEGANPKIDPFISPIFASDELLKGLPTVRIMAGEKDPLHDECWRLLKRLVDLKHDVHLFEYRDLCHGFLNFDNMFGIKETRTCVNDAIALMQSMLCK